MSENPRIKWDKVVFVHCVQHSKLDICSHWVLTLLFRIKIHLMGASWGFGRHQGCINICIEASTYVSLSVHHQTLLQLGVCLLTGRSSVESHSRYSATCTIWLMMRSSSYVKTKHNLQDRETINLAFRITSRFKHGANPSLFLLGMWTCFLAIVNGIVQNMKCKVKQSLNVLYISLFV